MAIRTPIEGTATNAARYLTAHSYAKGALFPLQSGAVSDGSAPVMTGSLEIASKPKVSVAAFRKKSSSTGNEYLNLRIGDEKIGIYYARLFRNIPKFRNNSPDFTGYVSLGDSENSPKLNLRGWELFHGAPPAPYISLEIGASRTTQSETSNESRRNGFPI